MLYSTISELSENLRDSNGNDIHTKTSRYFHALEIYGFQSGFTEKQLDETWRQILQSRLSQPEKVAAVHWIVPRDEILPETIDFIVAWISLNTTKKAIVKTLLQWLLAGLQSRVVQKQLMQNCYYLLLQLLVTTRFTHEICHLLYLLTDPNLITPYAVNQVLKLQQLYNQNDNYAALLSLYKRLKPHLLDRDDVKAITNDLQVFSRNSKKILLCFKRASQKLGYAPDRSLCRYPNWKLQAIAFKRRYLRDVVYISELTLPEAISEFKKSEIYFRGTMFESFLENPYGFIFIALTDRNFQNLLHDYIRGELVANVRLLNRKENDEFRAFLKSLIVLQQIYGQEIDAVGDFLRVNLRNWKGTSYVEEIFALLRNVVLSDYGETFDDVLVPLYRLNKQLMDPAFACCTVKSLAWCLYNNANDKKQNQIFMQTDEKFPTLEILLNFEKSFNHLCNLFVNTFENNSEILHGIAESHILLATIEEDGTFRSHLPAGIKHKILINSDYILIDKISRVMLLQIERDTNNSKSKRKESQPYRDFFKIFLKNILHSSIFTNSIHFETIDKEISCLLNIKMNFRLRNNLGFLPLARMDLETKLVTDFEKNKFLRNCEMYCRYFSTLIFLKNHM